MIKLKLIKSENLLTVEMAMKSTNIGSEHTKMLVLGSGQIKRSGTGGSLTARVILVAARW